PVRVWDAKTGELVRVLVEHGPRSNGGFALSPDGKTLAYSTVDEVGVTPSAPGGRSAALKGGGRKPSHLARTPDSTGRRAGASGEFSGNTAPVEPFGVRLFDLTKLPADGQPPEPVWRREGKFEDVWGKYPAAAFSPDGKRVLVSFNYKEQPVLLDAATGKE